LLRAGLRNIVCRVVIHLAARVGGLFANMADQIGFFEQNLAINQNVVKCCHAHDVARAIFCLSTCVFPAVVELPMNEKHIQSDFLLNR